MVMIGDGGDGDDDNCNGHNELHLEWRACSYSSDNDQPWLRRLTVESRTSTGACGFQAV